MDYKGRGLGGGGVEKWEEAERVSRKMGKAILGVRKSTVNEVVMGELGGGQ